MRKYLAALVMAQLLAGAAFAEERTARPRALSVTMSAAQEKVQVMPTEGKAVKISFTIKSGSRTDAGKLQCVSGEKVRRPKDCLNIASGNTLSPSEVDSMFLNSYFPGLPASFMEALKGKTKHSYTTHSGPQTFYCTDECADFALGEVEAGTSGVTGHWVCREWTHSCECTDHCY